MSELERALEEFMLLGSAARLEGNVAAECKEVAYYIWTTFAKKPGSSFAKAFSVAASKSVKLSPTPIELLDAYVKVTRLCIGYSHQDKLKSRIERMINGF